MRFLQPIFITGCLFAFRSVGVGPAVSALRSVHLFLSVKVMESNSLTHCELLSCHQALHTQWEPRGPRGAEDLPVFLVIPPYFLPFCLWDYKLIQTSLSLSSCLELWLSLSGSLWVFSLFISLENSPELIPKALKNSFQALNTARLTVSPRLKTQLFSSDMSSI